MTLSEHRLVSLTIDGQTVTAPEGTNILDAAREHGIVIPTLCSDEKLEPMAGCRMCLVEIEGESRPLPSCSTAVSPGIVVQTQTPRLQALRRNTLELILSDHNAYCQPPCQVACPTHIDIPGYLECIARGDHREAARLVKEVLPFPYILGLVCPRPCQLDCRRGLVEEEISICQCHGYSGEVVLDDPPTPWPQEPPNGHKVAVIGAGPAGLTAAYYLALKGYGVTVFEALPRAGGMLLYGIPEYRLPKAMMDKELECVWKLGVELVTNSALGKDFILDDLVAKGYEAIFLGVGAHKGNRLNIEGEDLPGVLPAVGFLRRVAMGEKVEVGPRVVVIGGGFTAFDASRTSRRLGATEVTVVYRRSRREMGAHYSEVDDAEHEGIKLEYQCGPVRIIEREGRAAGIEFVRMQLGEPDASGRRRPVPVPGSEFIIEADTIIPAIGQTPDLFFLENEKGVSASKRETIVVNQNSFRTGRDNVFAGGDATLGAATVIQAVACGKLAAKSIDGYLRGEAMDEVTMRLEAEEQVPDLISIVPYKPVQPQVRMRFLPFSEREGSFKLIELGYTEEMVWREAARCLQCVCPDAGICHLQKWSLEHGLSANRFHAGEAGDYRDFVIDDSHTFILRDPNKCINCTQCVRICRDVIGPDCYGLMGRGFSTIVSTPFNVSLKETDCVSCGACAETCPTGALMLRERDLTKYEIDVSRCIYCGDCVEVCPHGALGETPNFELAEFDRFKRMQLQMEDLARAPEYKHPPRSKAFFRHELKPSLSPWVLPEDPREWNE